MQFRKKAVAVEAFQWFEKMGAVGVVQWTASFGWYIRTLEGFLRVREGDWIVTGVAGECYPVAPEVFAETYEPVEETT